MRCRPMDDDRALVEDVFDQENDLKIEWRYSLEGDSLDDWPHTDKSHSASKNEKTVQCAIFNKFSGFFQCKTTTIA